MMEEPEDDRLDQSLRDTFSDFDLPPSGHVWNGIEGRLSNMPGPPRKVPLFLLLPAVGLVGVAVGWLLPHPTAPVRKPQPPLAAQAAVRPHQPLTQQPAVAYSAPPVPAGTTVAHPASATAPGPVATRPAPVATRRSRPAAVHPPLDSVVLTAEAQSVAPLEVAAAAPVVPEQAPAQMPPSTPAADSSVVAPAVAVTNAPLPGTTSAAYAPAEPPKQSPKNESLREWRPEYRTPKHRLEERGGRLRRIRTSITKHWQNLFKSRRMGPPTSWQQEKSTTTHYL